MIIDLGTGMKLRFDPQDVRISIDGDIIDIGARIKEEQRFSEEDSKPEFYCLDGIRNFEPTILELSEEVRRMNYMSFDEAMGKIYKDLEELRKQYNNKMNELHGEQQTTTTTTKKKRFLTPDVAKHLEEIKKEISKSKREE